MTEDPERYSAILRSVLRAASSRTPIWGGPPNSPYHSVITEMENDGFVLLTKVDNSYIATMTAKGEAMWEFLRL